ncbi:MAG: GumC family protein [Runella sp.]
MKNEYWNNTPDRYTAAATEIDVKRVVKVLWSRWYWILASLILALVGWLVFSEIATTRYQAEMLLKFNEKKTELNELSQLIQPDGLNSQEYVAEKYVIESEEVIKKAVEKLYYPFTFYSKSGFKKEDVYPFQPFTAQIISYDESLFKEGTFEIKANGIVSYQSPDKTEDLSFDINKDTLVVVGGLSFKINSIARLTQDYEFSYNDLNAIKNAVDDNIKVVEEEKNLPIVSVLFTYHNQKFTQDFLEKLIEAYGEYNLEQKKRSSNLTINFIREQIKIYAEALRKASSDLESYKQRSSVPSLQVSMADVMSQKAEFEAQKNMLEIQKSYINLIEQSLNNPFEPINIGNIGLDNNSDGVLLKLIGDLNKLILDRKAFIVGKNLSVNNPIVQAADDEIRRVREQILSNIKIQRQKNENTLEIVNRNLNILRGRLNALPSVERELGYLQNDRDVNEKIYLLLINKEIEASIVKAGMLPSFTVLSRTGAYLVYPRKIRILLACLLGGLVLGVGSIFLTRFLNSKFTQIHQIERSERIQLLGIIQRFPEKIQHNEKDLLRFLDHRSLFTESISSVRTNLGFLIDHSSPKGKLIVITSEISGEGKSFVTVNLATSLTKVGKKVLIVVSDLRRSKLHRFFNNNNKIGLSNYLSEKENDLQKVIQPSVIQGLDFIPAGPVPYNPAELIQNERFEKLISICSQQYDYVLVDTAPIGLVSDNIPLLNRSDLVLYVVRWLYSNKEAHLLAHQVAEDLGLKKLGVIINDFYRDDLYTDLAPSTSYYNSKGYGYQKYSYNYYGKENGYYTSESTSDKSVWDKLKNIIRK